jgi:hypothetical protein
MADQRGGPGRPAHGSTTMARYAAGPMRVRGQSFTSWASHPLPARVFWEFLLACSKVSAFQFSEQSKDTRRSWLCRPSRRGPCTPKLPLVPASSSPARWFAHARLRRGAGRPRPLMRPIAFRWLSRCFPRMARRCQSPIAPRGSACKVVDATGQQQKPCRSSVRTECRRKEQQWLRLLAKPQPANCHAAAWATSSVPASSPAPSAWRGNRPWLSPCPCRPCSRPPSCSRCDPRSLPGP